MWMPSLRTTGDLLITSELLCQLSHTSIFMKSNFSLHSVQQLLKPFCILPQILLRVNSYFALYSPFSRCAGGAGNTQCNHFPRHAFFPAKSVSPPAFFCQIRQNDQQSKIASRWQKVPLSRTFPLFFDRFFPLHLVYIILSYIIFTRSYPHFPHPFPHL